MASSVEFHIALRAVREKGFTDRQVVASRAGITSRELREIECGRLLAPKALYKTAHEMYPSLRTYKIPVGKEPERDDPGLHPAVVADRARLEPLLAIIGQLNIGSTNRARIKQLIKLFVRGDYTDADLDLVLRE